MLEIESLHVNAGDKEILRGVNLSVGRGEIHVILGSNGSGKSTLMNAIMGHPKYQVTGGRILFEGEDLTALKTFERARRGIFLSFQNPEEIPGITVENMLRTAKQAVLTQKIKILQFHKELIELMNQLQIDPEYANRYMNVGFSGGEKKRNEILQLLALNPKLALLDETDSGLDVDAVDIVSRGVAKFHNETNSCIIITHNAQILKHLPVTRAHIFLGGRIVRSGGADLVRAVSEHGYAPFEVES